MHNPQRRLPGPGIKNVITDSHYSDREEAVDIAACAATTRAFGVREHVAPSICGVCMAACPWGRGKKRAMGRESGP